MIDKENINIPQSFKTTVTEDKQIKCAVIKMNKGRDKNLKKIRKASFIRDAVMERVQQINAN